MKAFIPLVLSFAVAAVCLSGCGSPAASTSPAPASTVSASAVESSKASTKQIALEATTQGDYNTLALSFSQLVEDADAILRIQVQQTEPFVNENGMLQTKITPLVEEVYKGSFQDEPLYVNGGEMLYEEWSQYPQVTAMMEGHEPPDGGQGYAGQYVRQVVDGQSIPQPGESYIFFVKHREDTGAAYPLYAYQGIFKLVDGMVENSALSLDEPLALDLYTLFVNPEAPATLSTQATVPQEAFVQQLTDLAC